MGEMWQADSLAVHDKVTRRQIFWSLLPSRTDSLPLRGGKRSNELRPEGRTRRPPLLATFLLTVPPGLSDLIQDLGYLFCGECTQSMAANVAEFCDA